MKRKLTPVAGLVVAGLVGTAYATCYWKATGCCGVSGGTIVGTLLPCNNPIYAQGTWCPNDLATTNPGSGKGWENENTGAICHGPASYTDCNGFNHTYPDYSYGPTYTAVDTTSERCTF